MIRIAKTHLRLVNRKEFKIDEETTLHPKELGGVLKLLWLKRDAEKSSFWGHPPTEVPPNTHLTKQCQLPSYLLEVVNKSERKTTEQVLADHTRRSIWRKNYYAEQAESSTLGKRKIALHSSSSFSSFFVLGIFLDSDCVRFSSSCLTPPQSHRMSKIRKYSRFPPTPVSWHGLMAKLSSFACLGEWRYWGQCQGLSGHVS